MHFLTDLPQLDPMWYIGGAVTGLLMIAAAAKAGNEIRRYGWVPFRDKWVTPRRARRERIDELFVKFESVESSCSNMGGHITEILKEFRPNGGETLRDRVVSIDNKVENIVAQKTHEFETSDNPKFFLDEMGQMTRSNSAFRELINAEDERLEHNNYLALMDDDDRRRFVRSRDEAIQFLMPFDQIVKFKLRGPHFVTIRMQASPDVRHGGVLKGFFGTAVKMDSTLPQ